MNIVKTMTININHTNYTDEEIIAAVEAARDAGRSADYDNSAAAADPNAEEWEQIEYTMTVAIGDDSLLVVWRPTEDRYNDAVERDDTSDICDWDMIDEVW